VTKRLEQVIARLRGLPESRQNEIEELLDDIAESDPSAYRLTAEQANEVRRRMANPSRTVTNDEIGRFFARRT